MNFSKIGSLLLLLAIAVGLPAKADRDQDIVRDLVFLTEGRPSSEYEALQKVIRYLYYSRSLSPHALVTYLYQMAPQLSPGTISMLFSLNTVYNSENSSMVTKDFQGDLSRGENALTTNPSSSEVRARFIDAISKSSYSSSNLVRRLVQWYIRSQNPSILKIFSERFHELGSVRIPRRFAELLIANAEGTSETAQDAIYILWKMRLTPQTHGFLASRALNLLKTNPNPSLIGIWSRTAGSIDAIPAEIDKLLKSSSEQTQEAALWALANTLRGQDLLQEKIFEMWDRGNPREADLALEVMVATVRDPSPRAIRNITTIVTKKDLDYYATTVFTYIEERRKFVVDGKADTFTRIILREALASGIEGIQNEALRTVYRLGINEAEFVARALIISQSRDDFASESILKKYGFKFKGETFDRHESGNLTHALELARALTDGPLVNSMNALIAFWRQEIQERRAAEARTRNNESGRCQDSFLK